MAPVPETPEAESQMAPVPETPEAVSQLAFVVPPSEIQDPQPIER